MARTVCAVICFIFSLLFIGVGVTILVAFPGFYHSLIIKNVVLANKQTGYNSWVDPPFPIYFQVWMWNVTNPAEVMNGTKPYVTQVGPYTYRETRKKENVTFLSSDEEISYISPQIYEFIRDMSVGDPMEDNITTINIPYLTIVDTVASWPTSKKLLVQFAAIDTNSHVFESYLVDDLLWGYTDPLLNLIHKWMPDLVPTAVFGLFAEKNNSYDGVYVVDSGKLDPALTSSIKTFNGETMLDFWTTNTTNMINGTDGTYYHPYLNKSEPIYVFSTDICRSTGTTYEKPIIVQGVNAYRYVAPRSVFQNPTENPANIGFCTPDADSCLPGGLLNLSNCHQNAPIVTSLPHFLYAEQSVLDMLDGDIHPVKEEHQTSFDLEPTTGVPLQVFKRLQINVYQKAYEVPKNFSLLPTAFLPILWINESSAVPPAYAKQLQWMTTKAWLVAHIAQWVFIALGIILLVGMINCLLSGTKKSTKLELPINEPSENEPLLGRKD